MASANEIQLYADSAIEAHHIIDLAVDEVRRIECQFSRYRDDSLLSHINRSAGKNAVRVDAETAALLDYGDACFSKSDGVFDLTSGVLRRCWDFAAGRLPDPLHLRETLELVGWNKVMWSSPEIYLPISGMELDFGGIGKEYAADRAAAICLNQGIRHGLVNLAGDIRILGPQPDDSAWRIGIKHPRRPDTMIASIDLFSGALATSGDYERFFELDGRRYCHILDATTGYPVSEFRSVSVVAPLCSVAGSLSTIAMIKGKKTGIQFLQSEQAIFFAVDSDGKIETNAGSMVDNLGRSISIAETKNVCA